MALNNQAIKGSYRLPQLEDTLDQLVGAKFFSCLYLKNGYWQIEIEELDKHKTVFQYQVLDSTNTIACTLDCVMHQVHSNS